MTLLLALLSCEGPSRADAGACEAPPDPRRGLALREVLLRLDAQRCLHEEDIQVLERWEEDFRARSTLSCDTVYRLFSPDGERFVGTPERVLEHASVPDVVARPDGSHWLVYNDVTPGRLAQLLRADPERLFRQGLLGMGGVGLAIDRHDGRGFVVQEDLDLHLPALQEAVDPDLGFDPQGRLRLTWFGVDAARMTPELGPLGSAMPHNFYRSVSADGLDFSAPELVLASRAGPNGGSDPSMLTLPDGTELLFLAPMGQTAWAWELRPAAWWDPRGPASFDTGVHAATVDIVPVPGGWRMVYMQNGAMGRFLYSTSTDGRAWTQPGVEVFARGQPEFNFNPSVAVDGRGWWLYYNAVAPECGVRPGGNGPGGQGGGWE